MGIEGTSESHRQLESCAEFRSEEIAIVACFRALNSEVVAGGLVEVEFLVTNKSTAAFFLARGRSRTKLRPAFFSFTAHLMVDGREVPLDDPTVKITERGGPATQIRIAANATHRETLLVNEFVCLERATSALRPAQVGVLKLVCERPLPLATRPREALQIKDAAMLKSGLVIEVRRDDAALEALIGRLARDVDASRTATVSAQREQAVSELAALRSPKALPYLQVLADHPDPVVQLYVARALKLMNQE